MVPQLLAQTLHRVMVRLNQTKDNLYPFRESIAYFCQINPNEMVTCIPACLPIDKPPKYLRIQS